MTVSILASMSQALWRILESQDIDPAQVFRDAGLDTRSWNEPYARFSDAALDRAWIKAIELTSNPCLGLMAGRFSNPVSLHALGFAVLASDSLYDAMSRLVRYTDLISIGLKLQLSVAGEDCRLAIDPVSLQPGALAARTDAFLSGLIDVSRTMTSNDLAPKALTLRRRAPRCAAEYYALFRAPITFAATTDSITFERGIAERPLPTSNRVLARQCEQIIDDYLIRFSANTFSDRVRTRLIELLSSGAFAEADVARKMNVSPRTLQRRLADEGTSFKVLLDEARQELALRFIGERSLSIKEASYLLGFSEPGNFSRAFKRWTGTTPSSYRTEASGR